MTAVHEIVEFSKQPCFSNFVDFVAEARREGDRDKSKEVIGTLCKLLGNSSYGSTLLCQEKFHAIKYVKGFRKAAFAVNDPRFVGLNELCTDYFETEKYKRAIRMTIPVQIGFAVLSLAKMFMLRFYYCFLLKFLGRENFEFLETDTDSIYIALGEETLLDSVKPEMRDEFLSSLTDNCTDQYKVTDDSFIGRICCPSHIAYDKKLPGICKEEWRGSKMICLCSKSYVAVSSDKPENIKFSLKGVNKRNFVDPTDQFQKVLQTQQTHMAVNRGIRLRGNTLFTYEQSKKAMTYFYIKRKVHKDSVHTSAHDLTLVPRKRKRTREDAEFACDDVVIYNE